MSIQSQESWVPEWDFGDKVRKIRRGMNLSQAEFAARLDVKAPSIAAWETGTNEPRNIVSIAKRIELAFGVPAEWTLGLEMRNTPGPGPGGGERACRDSNPKPSDSEPGPAKDAPAYGEVIALPERVADPAHEPAAA